MNITCLVENHAKGDFTPRHGLSLYIETKQHKMLFDLGPDETLLENAERLEIDLAQVDTVILSHGHYDHGGGLEAFLKLNQKADIYVQKAAFEKYYSHNYGRKKDISLSVNPEDYPQIHLLEGDFVIDEELRLFVVTDRSRCYSSANDVLYKGEEKDDFLHEQNLILTEGEQTVLVLGCGHTGVLNILKKAESYHPKVCIGGFHLFNPTTGVTVEEELLERVAQGLKQYDSQFYTCHCTGEKAFTFLAERVPGMEYLCCGSELVL